MVSRPFAGGGFHARNSHQPRAPGEGSGCPWYGGARGAGGERRILPGALQAKAPATASLGPSVRLGPDAQIINHNGFLKA